MASTARKDSAALVSLLKNNEENDEEEEDQKITDNQLQLPATRKESKVVTALRKFNQIGTNIEEIRKPQFPGQQDSRPYSFAKNDYTCINLRVNIQQR
uniref:Uncharacterized protein n=1 Tax=Panagrolaimus superbus TaxID=310955 RepID=A0A914YHH0_9BILA